MMGSFSQVDLQPIAGSHEVEASAFSNCPKMHCRSCSSIIGVLRKMRTKVMTKLRMKLMMKLRMN